MSYVGLSYLFSFWHWDILVLMCVRNLTFLLSWMFSANLALKFFHFVTFDCVRMSSVPGTSMFILFIKFERYLLYLFLLVNIEYGTYAQ